jgi:signal transduction histidine kinase/ActR/RegA family two-component response regulator
MAAAGRDCSARDFGMTSTPSTGSPALAPPPWRQVARTRGMLAVLLVELVVAAMVAYGLYALRRQTLEGELRTLGSLSAAMAADADGTLDVADVVLRATRTELANGLLRPERAGDQAVLAARLAALPRYQALTVFGAGGQRLAGAQAAGVPPPLEVAQRAYFAAAQADASTGAAPSLFVDSPAAPAAPTTLAAPAAPATPAVPAVPTTPAADGPRTVDVAMDWRDAAGQFQGVVVLQAKADFLDGDFARIAPTPDTSLAVYRRDGELISDGPGDGSSRLLPAAALATLQADAQPERARLLDGGGGRQRLVAAHRLQRFPLLVVVSRDARAAMADWSDQAWLVGAFAASALAMTLFLCLRNAREQALQQRLQVQLQRVRKLQQLGTLAGGVAHDFNNILAAVIGYGEMARDGAAAGSAQARQLDQVLQAGQRGKALVERILSFSRSAPRPHALLRLQPVVDEVLQLLAGSLPTGVRLVPRLEAPEATVLGDATMVFEAAMNLCTNGIQAMHATGRGGRLGVALTVVDIGTPLALYAQVLAPGRYVRLAVSDSGPGIAPEVQARLFEPFFTTKEPQQGTGLGLAVVHGVVQELGGAIDVHSAPGRGTRFVLYFPCVDAPPADATAPAAGAMPLGEGQTVLVVDDEPALVALTEELLAELGYESFGLTSSRQALAEVQADPARFDLVLTDEQMPELPGTALAAALHALRPDLPVVVVSGYGGPQLAARAAGAGVAVVVGKPLVRAELAQAVARALGTWHG